MKYCWFCQVHKADADPVTVELYRLEDADPAAVALLLGAKAKYLKTKVQVPKCSFCQKQKDKYDFWFVRLPLLVSVIVAFCWSFWAVFIKMKHLESVTLLGQLGYFLIGVIAICLIGMLVTLFLSVLGDFIADMRGVAGESHARLHPKVRALKSQGWRIGDRPSKNESLDKAYKKIWQ